MVFIMKWARWQTERLVIWRPILQTKNPWRENGVQPTQDTPPSESQLLKAIDLIAAVAETNVKLGWEGLVKRVCISDLVQGVSSFPSWQTLISDLLKKLAPTEDRKLKALDQFERKAIELGLYNWSTITRSDQVSKCNVKPIWLTVSFFAGVPTFLKFWLNQSSAFKSNQKPYAWFLLSDLVVSNVRRPYQIKQYALLNNIEMKFITAEKSRNSTIFFQFDRRWNRGSFRLIVCVFFRFLSRDTLRCSGFFEVFGAKPRDEDRQADQKNRRTDYVDHKKMWFLKTHKRIIQDIPSRNKCDTSDHC